MLLWVSLPKRASEYFLPHSYRGYGVPRTAGKSIRVHRGLSSADSDTRIHGRSGSMDRTYPLSAARQKNSLHDTSAIAFASLWFFSIPCTFRCSTAIVWFSRTSRAVTLCRKSLRMFAIRSWTRETRIRCLSRFFDFGSLRESRFCSLASFRESLWRICGFATAWPLLSV